MSFQAMEQELYTLKGPLRKGVDHQEFFQRFDQLTRHLDPKKNIVVVGTNGKGTTCQLIFHLLKASGYKVGLFTSPHLVHLSERFRYQNEYPSEADLMALRGRAGEKVKGLKVSFFEMLTVMALEWFSDLKNTKGLDFVVWEAGLGGRFDPAARVPHEITVLTTISYDHQSLLGESLSEIAGNKVGAITAGGVLISNAPLKEWEPTLRNEIKDKSARWLRADQLCPVDLVPKSDERRVQQLSTPWGQAGLKLLGPMAKSNLQLALCAFHEITGAAPHLKGLEDIQFWGRMQWLLNFKIPVLLSGDHNPEGWQHLRSWLKEENLHGVIIYRLSRDDKREPFLEVMSDLPQFQLVEGGRSDSEIASQSRKFQNALSPGAIMAVTGSLYFVGDWIKALGVRPPTGR